MPSFIKLIVYFVGHLITFFVGLLNPVILKKEWLKWNGMSFTEITLQTTKSVLKWDLLLHKAEFNSELWFANYLSDLPQYMDRNYYYC